MLAVSDRTESHWDMQQHHGIRFSESYHDQCLVDSRQIADQCQECPYFRGNWRITCTATSGWVCIALGWGLGASPPQPYAMHRANAFDLPQSGMSINHRKIMQ